MAEVLKNFFKGSFIDICIKLAVAALILIIGFWLTKIVSKLLKKGRLMKRADAAVRGFTESAVSVVLKILTVITAAAYLGVPMASVVAVLGSAGLAIGLAIQGGLSNVAGGVILIINRPFSVGDFITIDDKSGTVQSVGIYYTTIRTPNNRKIVIPNGVVAGSVITNLESRETVRLDLTFCVSYDSDSDTVRRVLLALAAENEKIEKEPAPKVVLTEHADSALKFCLQTWVKSEDYWTVNFEMNEKAKKAFDENGISIPFPQLDVHIDERRRGDCE